MPLFLFSESTPAALGANELEGDVTEEPAGGPVDGQPGLFTLKSADYFSKWRPVNQASEKTFLFARTPSEITLVL